MTHIPLSEIFDQVQGLDREKLLRKLVADKGFVEGGISYNTTRIYSLSHNDYFEIAQLRHLIDTHYLLNVKNLDAGWLTDFMSNGFERETKESLLKLTLASFNDYINNIRDISLAKNESEKIGTYIFMVAYLNTIKNGEFSYGAFFSDVEFLSNKVLGKFKSKDEELQKKYNPFSIICNALPNSVDFVGKYIIDKGEVKDNYIPITYGNFDVKKMITIDTKLMEQLFEYGYLKDATTNNIEQVNNSTVRGNLLFNLDIKPEHLKEILGYIFHEAFALDIIEKGQRAVAYSKIEESITPEEHKLLKKETNHFKQASEPSPFVRVKNAIQAFFSRVFSK
jgi:hypothetical protein